MKFVSRNSCPNCRKRPPWAQYVAEGPLWPCAGCGRMLRYSPKHHRFFFVAIVLCGPLAVMLHVTAGIHWGIFVPAYVVCAWAYVIMTNRVMLVDSHDGIYCTTCMYDLRATVADHLPSCPECGTAIPPNRGDNSA